MELCLIRHALPVRIDGGDGPADPQLAPSGAEQAALLGSWWSKQGISAIYSSPMRRARETAAPLAAATGLDVVLDDGLKEFDAHLDFYVPIEELRADEAVWEKLVEEWLSPEAEVARQEFRRGVVTTIDAIAAEHGDERVAVVCHGGVINAYLSSLISLPGTMWFEPAYTSVSRALVDGDYKQIISVNEAPHLPSLVVPTKLA